MCLTARVHFVACLCMHLVVREGSVSAACRLLQHQLLNWEGEVQVRAKKEYTPFPPPQLPRKVDLQLESGEYFLSKEIKEAKAAEEKHAAQASKVQDRKRQRQDTFVAPEVRSSHVRVYLQKHIAR